MSRPIPALIAVGAAVVIVVASVVLLRTGPGTNVGGALSTPSPTPSATFIPSGSPPAAFASPIDTSAWTAYTSSRYGFTIGHPDDWNVDPADRAWDIDKDAPDWRSPATDSFSTPGPTDDLGVRVSVWKVALAPGTIVSWETSEVEKWYEEVYCPKTGSTSCAGIHDRAVPLCLEVRDCHPGMLLASPVNDTQAFFSSTNDDGMTVVTIWRSESDPSTARYGGTQRLLEAFLSTMNVWPKDRRPAFEDQFWPPSSAPSQ